jgi:osmotically inducible protein OsmC
MKTIHVAEMVAEGGRDGKVEAPDGSFSVALLSDEQPASLTPEHLFAGAYAACFLSAVKHAAERSHIELAAGSVVTGRAHLEETPSGVYQLGIDLRATLPGLGRSEAQHLMNLAHQTCPYSQATRGNISVTLALD